MEPNDLNEAREPARVEGLKHEWRVEGSRHGNTKPRLPHLSHMRRQAHARPQRQELLTIDPAAHILGRPISQQDLVHLDALRFAGHVEPSSGPLAGPVHAQGQPHHPGLADRATLRGRRAARGAANRPGAVPKPAWSCGTSSRLKTSTAQPAGHTARSLRAPLNPTRIPNLC
jgi:hypothetical protein